MWAQLRRDEPHLLSNFEEFLARVTFQIKEAKEEKREMERALQRLETTNTSSLCCLCYSLGQFTGHRLSLVPDYKALPRENLF